MSAREATFPLVLRRRLVGLSYGGMDSARRGSGFELAGSRPYRPGDPRRSIDWAASARLSSARGVDEFVVRERYAEEAPRVVIVVDRRPGMALYPPPLPWLSKPEAVAEVGALIADSAVAARGFIGYLDYATGGPEPFWRAPQGQSERWHIKDRHLRFDEHRAAADNLEQGLRFLARTKGTLFTGSFVFVLSDFLEPPPDEAWLGALERRWDVVPVVIQDPVWEASFPDLDAVVVPFADAGGGRVRPVRMTRKQARERRELHEERRAELLARFRNLALEPVIVETADRGEILRRFLDWTDQRLYERRRGW